MCDSIIRLLEDTTVPKIGLSLHDDIHSLREVAQFSPGLFIDIQHKVKDFGVEDLSLQKLYANFLGGRISKGQRLTNWEADVLSESQKRYAATDAWACILLYEEMERLKQTGEYEVIMDEDETIKNCCANREKSQACLSYSEVQPAIDEVN